MCPSALTFNLGRLFRGRLWLACLGTKDVEKSVTASNKNTLTPRKRNPILVVGLHESPRHLFVHVISGFIFAFLLILCDEFLFLHVSTSVLNRSRGTRQI